MGVVDFALWFRRREARDRALELERRTREKPELPPGDPVLAAREALHDPVGLRVGHLLSGPPVRVRPGELLRSGIVAGSSGSGKTHFGVYEVDQLLRRAFGFGLAAGTTPLELELELIDPKSETFELVALALATLHEEAPDELRERIATSVRVITWSSERISPFAPYAKDLRDSDAFHAYVRTDVATTASRQDYPETVRQLRFMTDRLLTAKRFPPNLTFLTRLLRDAAFRARIVEPIADPDVRAYFLDLDANVPKQTVAAYLRRVQTELSFPEVRLALGVPPDALARLLPRAGAAPIVLADFGPAGKLPAGICLERAGHHVIDTLRGSARRDPARPKVLVIEELPTLLAGAPALVEPLATAARTLRSAGVGVWYITQDFVGAVSADLARTLQLNAFWLAVFRSGKAEAEWLVGHAADAGADGTEARRAFVKRIEDLPVRHFFLRVKGSAAIPLVTDDVPTVGAERRAKLLERFWSQIAVRSTIPAKVAEDAIAAWEAEIVPPPAATSPKKSAGGIQDLLRELDAAGDDDAGGDDVDGRRDDVDGRRDDVDGGDDGAAE